MGRWRLVTPTALWNLASPMAPMGQRAQLYRMARSPLAALVLLTGLWLLPRPMAPMAPAILLALMVPWSRSCRMALLGLVCRLRQMDPMDRPGPMDRLALAVLVVPMGL